MEEIALDQVLAEAKASQVTVVEGSEVRDSAAGNIAGPVGENSAAMTAELMTGDVQFETASAAAAVAAVGRVVMMQLLQKGPTAQGMLLGVLAEWDTVGWLEGTVVVVEQQDAGIAETLHYCC